MKVRLSVIVGFCLLWVCFGAFSQPDSTEVRKKFSYGFELGTYASINEKLPFWLRSNQFGAVPENTNSIYFRQQIESKTDTTARFFHVNYCVDLMTIVGNEARLILPEAFVDLRFGAFSLSGGRFKNVFGLMDTTLSSGSITWSGNSLSPPEIRLSIPEYRKFLFKWLSVKGHYSHGWFGEQEKVTESYLHRKALYGRLGKPEKKLHLYGGILHNAQWGGKPKYELPDGDDRFTNGRFPEDWFTYGQVIFPYQSRNDSSGTYGLFEETNRFGNHIGQIDLGGTLKIKNTELMLYKQTIFETGATFSSLANTDDGIYGMSLKGLNKEKTFQRFVVEFIHTMNQGGYQPGLARLLGLQDRQFGTETFYFNHMQYLDGWTYRNRSIGTPFLIADEEIKVENKRFENDIFINNNRIKALYLGTILKLNSILIESRVSVSRNFGSQFDEIPPADQVSFMLKTCIPMPKLGGQLLFKVGIDQGELIKDNYGVNLAFRRSW